MDQRMPKRAIAFVVLTATLGAIALADSLLHWQSNNSLKFVCYLAIAMLASTLKVRLPGIESTMSVHFLLILLGVLELSVSETMVIGCSAALLQSLWKTEHKPEALKVTFNVLSMTANAVWVTYFAYGSTAHLLHDRMPFQLIAITCTYFLMNTVPLSIVIALSQRSSMRRIWSATYFWSFPYYLIGAALVGLISFCDRLVGWEVALLLVPVMYWIFRSYYLYLGRLEDEKKRAEMEARQVEAEKRHVEEVCALHLRTIEGLALAIEAKDHSALSHLRRVQTYAIGIAQELGMSGPQLDGLRAAALLHDIGKLAVPDHVINKPGRLTPEEFNKMKIHPIVGAEIVEKVAFPYPVAPIVRAHHEKWNGEGYPDGLKGTEIPLGARILSAVDCLDALASNRQYRKALSIDAAILHVVRESGKSFDPAVVEVLQRKYVELEKLANATDGGVSRDPLSFEEALKPGEAPGAGLEVSKKTHAEDYDFLSHIASARYEAHTLFELSRDLGNSLSLDETLSLVASRLRKLVPYDSIAAFVRKGDLLTPEFVNGEHFRALSSLRIPVGTGLCGWVAENGHPIVNGNPAVEIGFSENPELSSGLRSALAVPLEGVTGSVGVLTLYQAIPEAFNDDHLRVLQVITSRVAMFIENALKYREAESFATIDYLTGMANARALSVHLEQELARCKREQSSTAIIVCDLDGFKQINDRYGHLAGDKVLKLFAAALEKSCRRYDYASRMGGDEFVIVAPAMTEAAICERTQMLSSLAKHAGHEVCGADFLSMSAGVAFYPEDGQNAEQLLAEADRRMYATKRSHHTVVPMKKRGDCLEEHEYWPSKWGRHRSVSVGPGVMDAE